MTNLEKETLLDLYHNNPMGWKKILTAKANKNLLDALIAQFPQDYSLKEMLYLLDNNLAGRPKCPVCGNEITTFKRNTGYGSHCSCKCTQLDSEVRKKNKQTNLLLYGVENGAQSEQSKEKYKKLMQEKYGVSNSFQAAEIKEKIKQTNLEKYGVANPRQNKEIQDKAKQTLIEKYGITCGYLNHEDYHKSNGELELGQFLIESGFKIKQTDHSTIFPYELDIKLTDYNIGIEYDGTYWHSLPNMVARDIKKDNICKDKNIILIRVKEEDWIKNNEETKQKLLAQLEVLTKNNIV